MQGTQVISGLQPVLVVTLSNCRRCSSTSVLPELKAQFGEKLNGSVDVFYNDADVVHALDRHDVSLALEGARRPA
jgi:3-phosphoglycerate kinase